MSQRSTKEDESLVANYSLTELIEILIKHKDLHEGVYSLALQFQVGFGGVGPSEEEKSPGAMIGVTGIGLVKSVDESNQFQNVDAALVNPVKIKQEKKISEE